MWSQQRQPKWMGKAILCAALILPGDSSLPQGCPASSFPSGRAESRLLPFALGQLCSRNCHSTTPHPLCHPFINLS